MPNLLNSASALLQSPDSPEFQGLRVQQTEIALQQILIKRLQDRDRTHQRIWQTIAYIGGAFGLTALLTIGAIVFTSLNHREPTLIDRIYPIQQD